jgi:hypothetical protein
MPVLRQHHVLEALTQPADERHHLVAPRHREPAARAEVVLYIDDQQDVAVGDLVTHGRVPFGVCGVYARAGCARRARPIPLPPFPQIRAASRPRARS